MSAFRLQGSNYTSSVPDTQQPTVSFPGGIGSLSAGEISITGGARRHRGTRRRRGHRGTRRHIRRNRTVRNRRRCN